MSYEATHRICIDLETTGLNPDEDAILEVGAIFLTRNLTVLDTYSAVIYYHPELRDGMINNMPQAVYEMHTKNGLIADMAHTGLPMLTYVDRVISDMMAGLCSEPWEIMGSGVARFDHPFIQAQMPMVASRLYYAEQDVGYVRRFLRAAGLDDDAMVQNAKKTHRALDDARQHLAEFSQFAHIVNPHCGLPLIAFD